jgi:hypothetical protein
MFKTLASLLCLTCFWPALCLAGSVTNPPGTPTEPDLLDFGINPDFFLLTGNTMYEYNGIYELEIIAAQSEPGTGTSLAGLTIEQILVILGDAGGLTPEGAGHAGETDELTSTPEPETAVLCVAGALAFLAYKRVQFKKSGDG